MPPKSDSVTFRLPEDLHKDLVASAEKHGTSHHKRARDLVIAGLQDANIEELRQEMAEVRNNLERLREDLATAVASLLVNAGKVDRKQAEEWTRKTLLR